MSRYEDEDGIDGPFERAMRGAMREDKTTREAQQALNWLAGMPGLGHTTVTAKVLKKMLLDTGGQLLLAGRLYDITSKHQGAGVYRVCTRLTNLDSDLVAPPAVVAGEGE